MSAPSSAHGGVHSAAAKSANVAIVGGGIIGLATAHELLTRFPSLRVIVLEKEPAIGQHQTGHNSGVLHSGIYYRPGSLRAKNCRAGKAAMEQFCREQEIPFEICGKVIVATREAELTLIERIFERGQANGVRCEVIGPQRLHELEPHAAGIRAIHVPEAGIVDYRRVCARLAELVQQSNGQIICRARVLRIHERVNQITLETTAGDFSADNVVTCAGLHSDRVARSSGRPVSAKIVPFRGEYYELVPGARHLCRNLIYPVPDPNFPFLGVHFTRRIDGQIECGPNAVLAFAREGYRKRDVNFHDLAETLTYGGFLRLAARHWRSGLDEMRRSFSKVAFVRALQQLVPAIRPDDLTVGGSGVRAQAVTPHGTLVDDFLISQSDRLIHVCNAPSPAATASLNIARLIVQQLATRLIQ
jgi:(S)-2-hydroxyglutarate dehydrogenase